MSSSSVVWWGFVGAILSGVVFILLSLLSLADPEPASYRDVIFGVAWLSTVVPVAGLYAVQRQRSGLLGQIGAGVLVLGAVAAFIGSIAIAAGNTSFEWLAFPVSALLLFVGLVLFGIAILRARVVPSWCGIALIVALPLVFVVGGLIGVEGDAGDYPSVFVVGLVWLAVGYVLWSRWEVTTNDFRLS